MVTSTDSALTLWLSFWTLKFSLAGLCGNLEHSIVGILPRWEQMYSSTGIKL